LLRRSHNFVSSEAPPGKRQARPIIAISSLFMVEGPAPGGMAMLEVEEYEQEVSH